MTNEAITKFIEAKNHTEKAVNVHFKTRGTVTGIFIRGNDYEELRSKNFWRIVTNANIEQWGKTKNINLTRIFNGSEFTRISEN